MCVALTIRMSPLRLCLFTSLVVYSFGLAVTTGFGSREDELRKEINETRKSTAEITEEIVDLKKRDAKVKNLIQRKESTLNAKIANFTAEERTIHNSIFNLTIEYNSLNILVNNIKKFHKYYTERGYRVWFEVTLLKADYGYYGGLNQSGVEKTCFEFLHNKTSLHLPNLNRDVRLDNNTPTTKNPNITVLEAELRIAKENLNTALSTHELTKKQLVSDESYLIALYEIEANFTYTTRPIIDALKKKQEDLRNRVKEVEHTLISLKEKFQKASNHYNKGRLERERYRQLVARYQPAEQCYEKIRDESYQYMQALPPQGKKSH